MFPRARATAGPGKADADPTEMRARSEGWASPPALTLPALTGCPKCGFSYCCLRSCTFLAEHT